MLLLYFTVSFLLWSTIAVPGDWNVVFGYVFAGYEAGLHTEPTHQIHFRIFPVMCWMTFCLLCFSYKLMLAGFKCPIVDWTCKKTQVLGAGLQGAVWKGLSTTDCCDWLNICEVYCTAPLLLQVPELLNKSVQNSVSVPEIKLLLNISTQPWPTEWIVPQRKEKMYHIIPRKKKKVH